MTISIQFERSLRRARNSSLRVRPYDFRRASGGVGGEEGGRTCGKILNADNATSSRRGRGRGSDGNKKSIIDRDDDNDEGEALTTSTKSQN